MVVEIDEQLPVGGQMFIQPGALLGGQVLEKLLSRDALGLAHDEQDIGLHLDRDRPGTFGVQLGPLS